MDVTPDVDRQKLLRLDGFSLGMSIIWCPECDFQLPPRTVGYNQCPDCGHRGFRTTCVSEELKELVA